MSEKLPQQPQNEEVDLIQLFKYIGRVIEKLFSFIRNIFKGFFSAIIYTIKPFVVNIKLVVTIIIISSVLGYILEKVKEPIYFSEMLVKPHFDSKYQLASNIDYFNSLIGSHNLLELSSIFEIDTISASKLVSFGLEPGPETQNDLFIQYDEYVRSIDTSLVDELSYVEFIKNRGPLSGHLFLINAKSKKKDVFIKLQEGFRKTFENNFSKHQKKVRDTLAFIERKMLMDQLVKLDSIQRTYLEVIKNESLNSNLSLGLGSVIPLQEEKSTTKEYELFLKEQEIGRTLIRLNKEVAEENTFFDVLSGFDKTGTKDKSIQRRYFILFPFLVLSFLFFFFLAIKAFNFIKNYE